MKREYSESRNRATQKYKAAHYKRVPFDVRIEFYDAIIAPAVQASGLSMNAFLKEAVEKAAASYGIQVK